MIPSKLTNESTHVLWSTESVEDTLIIEMEEEGCVLHQTGDIIYLSKEQLDYLIKLARKKKK